MAGSKRTPRTPAKRTPRITPEVIALFIEAVRLGRAHRRCGRVGCERCKAKIDADMKLNRALGVAIYDFGPSESCGGHPLRLALLRAAREAAARSTVHQSRVAK